MALPPSVYLRRTSGESVGPVILADVEALFDCRIIDRRTPISADGAAFVQIAEWPEMASHLDRVKKALDEGAAAFTPPEPPKEPSPPTPTGPETRSVIRILLETAAQQATGCLVLEGTTGRITVGIREGKIARADSDREELELGAYLVENGVLDLETRKQAEAQRDRTGGDLGNLLIEGGIVPPHIYLEHYLDWTRSVLAAAVADRRSEVSFRVEPVDSPPFPLGLDRFGIVIEAVRLGMVRATLADRLAAERGRVVIPAALEGVQLEDCKLQPRELRALNAVNGVRTLQEILDELGGSEERSLPVLRAIFFAEQAGFLSFGEDPLHRKELAEARSLERRLQAVEETSFFEILGVNERNSDEEVRSSYAALAKQFHPDRVRQEAAPELREARERYFALISEAFEALDTEEKRYAYAQRLEQGLPNQEVDEAKKVQDTLHAETLFKKAEVLIRVRKYDEALEFLREARTLSPDDIEFHITEVYATYLFKTRQGDPAPLAQQAVKQLTELLKKNAEIAVGYLYLGHLYTALGKSDLALKAFTRVLEYQPHHPEAQQQVRLGRMRKERKATKKKKLFGL